MRDCANYTEFLAPERCPLITENFRIAAGISDSQDVKLYIGICHELDPITMKPIIEVFLKIDEHSHELTVHSEGLNNATLGKAIAQAYTTNMLYNVGTCDFAL